MTLPPSSSDDEAPRSNSFDRLHPALQKWVWKKNWASLRDIQESAISAILDGEHDILIAATTAGGKTEAAFLPVLTRVADQPSMGIRVLGISPLKALINDQYGRLEELGEAVNLSVHRWHGDVAEAHKKRILKNPTGILLITPESLEAMFVRRGTLIRTLFAGLSFVIVDELHAFVGSERGCQLQALLHRLELVLRRPIPRIGLSATLGDMAIAAEFLRPNRGGEVIHLVSSELGGEVRLQLRGYVRPRQPLDQNAEETTQSASRRISGHIYENLRGTRNLIFANRKSAVEEYADALRTLCETQNVPNEFFPHHGSLSKELREEVEGLLKDGDTPVSAICTSTLELGIDIGDVESVAQIGSPPSVASLRQRLGRSGRRGGPAILRIYVDEPQITADTSLLDTLRVKTFESVAMVSLLLQGWIEPPVAGALHLSTLVQQTLSVIAQVAGATAREIWGGLCEGGPFSRVDATTFAAFLRSLSAHDLIIQSADGTLLLGTRGERLVNGYDFYSAFSSDDEYRIEHEGRLLGSIPISHALIAGQMLIFAGRRWTVRHVDEEQKRVSVIAAAGGSPPAYFGGGPLVHDKVRQEMFRLYIGTDVPPFLDPGARSLVAQGRESFRESRLAARRIIASGDEHHAFLWAGDRVLDTIAVMLRQRGVKSFANRVCLSVADVDEQTLIGHFESIMAELPQDPKTLAVSVANKRREKHDHFLADDLLCDDYASRDLDVGTARRVLSRVLEGISPISE